MKHDRKLLEQIHTRTFDGIDTLKEIKGNSYAIIETLVELDTLMGLMNKFDMLPLFHKDQDIDLYYSLSDLLSSFYVSHQHIIDLEKFTFVDNYYHVDFNEIISNIEQHIKEDLKI